MSLLSPRLPTHNAEPSSRRQTPNLKIVRSGDLIGDGAQEYVAAHMLPQQPKKGMYVSRLLIARAQNRRCSIVLDVAKNGPRNPVGYVGIAFIDDGSDFYGYAIEFNFDAHDPIHRTDIYLQWLTPEREPEGWGVEIGWNKKIGLFQEYGEEGSSEMFKPEVRNPPHHNSKNCPKLCDGNGK